MTTKGISDKQRGVQSVKIQKRQYDELKKIAVTEGRLVGKVLQKVLQTALDTRRKKGAAGGE